VVRSPHLGGKWKNTVSMKKKRLFHKSLTRVQYFCFQHHLFIKGLLLKVLVYLLLETQKKKNRQKKSSIKLRLHPNYFSNCKTRCGRSSSRANMGILTTASCLAWPSSYKPTDRFSEAAIDSREAPLKPTGRLLSQFSTKKQRQGAMRQGIQLRVWCH